MKESLTRYRSADFYESAIILSARIPLIKIDRSNGDKFVTFIFDDQEYQAENIIEMHWSGELKLPTRDIIRSIHELKQRMYSKVARS